MISPNQSVKTLLNSEPIELKLQTRRGSDIDNGQSLSYSILELSEFQKLDREYGGKSSITFRTDGSFIYNCHGMTFASRRTMITLPSEIRKILEEDEYLNINETEVLPGDVAIYMKENGEIEHSATVLTEPSKETLLIPRVVSKWGKYKEVIHWVSDCPYKWDKILYYRVKQ